MTAAAAVSISAATSMTSEYSAKCFNRRAFVTGFTGSAGTAVVLKNEVRSKSGLRHRLHACCGNGAPTFRGSSLTELYTY